MVTSTVPLSLAIIGTDTGVGKTHIATRLVRGLRQLGRRVWIHKPVACGGWDGTTAEDGRAWRALVGDGQPPATVCPRQYPEPCSPHLAAEAIGDLPTLADFALNLARARPRHGEDFIVEGVGGLLVPLTCDRDTVADLLMLAELPVVVVARPHLGTLNHTALTIEVARSRGLEVVGIVINDVAQVPDTLATRTVAAELTACTHTPVLAHIGYDDDPALTAMTLASRFLDHLQPSRETNTPLAD